MDTYRVGGAVRDTLLGLPFHETDWVVVGGSAEQMLALCDYYLTRFHLRPRYIGKKLVQAFVYPSEGLRTAKSAVVFMKKLVSGQMTFSKPPAT